MQTNEGEEKIYEHEKQLIYDLKIAEQAYEQMIEQMISAKHKISSKIKELEKNKIINPREDN